ncbi:hypothetical protein C2G38_2202993 [Gigaspora rosea]|uniref:Uncharacterized protein n=1 Tax=Gigaspora rosea TaxID=44941 RepID=A0A397UN81_9GLOM|nr:hypothetical protein C2G38_2202993 [Gigaspora rosea]
MTLTKRPLIQDIAMLVVNFRKTALRRLSVHLLQKDLSAFNNNDPSRISSSDPSSFNRFSNVAVFSTIMSTITSSSKDNDEVARIMFHSIVVDVQFVPIIVSAFSGAYRKDQLSLPPNSGLAKRCPTTHKPQLPNTDLASKRRQWDSNCQPAAWE